MTTRIKIAVITVSTAVLASIAAFEGFRSEAYPDPVHGWKVPTIGYGTTEGVKRGDVMTEAEAFERLEKDAESKYANALRKCFGDVELHPHEFGAFVSLSWNVGYGAVCRSSIVPKVQNKQYEAACRTILTFKYAGGQDCSHPNNRTCRGLWERRQAEYAHCMGENL